MSGLLPEKTEGRECQGRAPVLVRGQLAVSLQTGPQALRNPSACELCNKPGQRRERLRVFDPEKYNYTFIFWTGPASLAVEGREPEFY